MEFTGRLAVFPASALLQWAHTERRTGTLVVRRRQREKRVLFRQGRIEGCLGNRASEQFGQYLLSHGHLEAGALVDALSHCRRSGKPLGMALVELGILPAERVRQILRAAIEEGVCDLFLWKHGLFYFEEQTPPPVGLVPEEIDTIGLVFEGTRWIDEDARIRKVFIHDQIVLARGPQWPGEDLPPLQRHILQSFAGEATVAQLYERAGGVEFPFLEAVYELTRAQVLEIARVGADRPAESIELDLRHLLLEQTGREEIVVGSERVVVPLEFLEQLYPAWIRQPGPGEIEHLAPELRDLARGLDGRTPLKRLFAPDDETRSDQIEYLLLELRRRNLALLPARLEDVERRLEGSSPLRRLLRRLR